jgi:hypothetical protein
MTIVTGFLLLWPALPALAQERLPAEIVLAPGEATAVPAKQGVAFANGGVIDVAQPNPATVVVTMTGLTATNADLCRTSLASYSFNLLQAFDVVFVFPRVKGAKLSLEGRVIGLLRTDHEMYTHRYLNHKCGTADTHSATAAVTALDGPELVALSMPARAATAGEDLSVYNHEGPFVVSVGAGKYVLHGTWGFGTTHPAFHCHGASAEFAPQPSYFPGPVSYWFEHWQPFNGAATKDFGYQLTIKLIPEFKDEKEEMPPKDKEKPKE